MKAMVLNKLCSLEENKNPLEFSHLPDPVRGVKEILIKVSACGVCHTELDEIEGRTPPAFFPIILGHQVVGRVEETSGKKSLFKHGDMAGVAWIYSACGKCQFCMEGNENLCGFFKGTGRDAHGGYAQYMTVLEAFAYKIPEVFSAVEAAPLLCAGAIGYRSLKLTGIRNGQNLGLTGFGASAHIVMKMVRHQYPDVRVFVFARSMKERKFAKDLGAFWTGETEEDSPESLDSIIDTTPVWKPLIKALKNLKSSGRLIINAIRKEHMDKEYLLQLDYPSHLWMEKEIKSVANVTRSDVKAFLDLAARIPIRPEIQVFKLEEANTALIELKERKIRGAKVLKIE